MSGSARWGAATRAAAVAWGDCYHRDVFVRVLYLLRACLPLVAVNDLTPFLLAAQYGDAANVRERSSRKDPLCPPASCVWGGAGCLRARTCAGVGPGRAPPSRFPGDRYAQGRASNRAACEHYVNVMLGEHLRRKLDIGINARAPVRLPRALAPGRASVLTRRMASGTDAMGPRRVPR